MGLTLGQWCFSKKQLPQQEKTWRCIARHFEGWSTLGFTSVSAAAAVLVRLLRATSACAAPTPPSWPWHSLLLHSLCPTPTVAARPENEPSSVQPWAGQSGAGAKQSPLDDVRERVAELSRHRRLEPRQSCQGRLTGQQAAPTQTRPTPTLDTDIILLPAACSLTEKTANSSRNTQCTQSVCCTECDMFSSFKGKPVFVIDEFSEG